MVVWSLRTRTLAFDAEMQKRPRFAVKTQTKIFFVSNCVFRQSKTRHRLPKPVSGARAGVGRILRIAMEELIVDARAHGHVAVQQHGLAIVTRAIPIVSIRHRGPTARVTVVLHPRRATHGQTRVATRRYTLRWALTRVRATGDGDMTLAADVPCASRVRVDIHRAMRLTWTASPHMRTLRLVACTRSRADLRIPDCVTWLRRMELHGAGGDIECTGGASRLVHLERLAACAALAGHVTCTSALPWRVDACALSADMEGDVAFQAPMHLQKELRMVATYAGRVAFSSPPRLASGSAISSISTDTATVDLGV